jgi:RNA polymerase sigma-70 factor, ECF subfamily
MTGNATDALDASQETFSILFRRLDDFGFRSRFSSWVYRIAINASIDLMRREWRSRDVPLDSGVPTGNMPGPDLDPPTREPQDMPREATARHELPSIVQGAIDRLSPKLREVAVLRYCEDLTYDDIAESLEISLGTVKSRLARAHQALRVSLGPALEGGRST